MRTFIAVELEPAVRAPVVKLLRGLPADRDVRWCTEHQLHVTLKFLGDVREAGGRDAHPTLVDVCAAAAAASRQVEPFTIRIRGLGCFPSPHSPRVLWCGVDDPAGGCKRWVELADPLFTELGFPPEQRGFTPHITLGRVKGAGGGGVFQRVLEEAVPPLTPEMQATHVTVFESQLLPTGAVYKVVTTAALGAGE
jgi:2'-5' RNA ligase